MLLTSSSYRRKFAGADRPISLSEIISALSFALDLTEGALRGHALRSCLFGMRIAAKLSLTDEERSGLYYALLLKDIGCSSNAARMAQIIGGDDRMIKSGAKLEDWPRPLWGNVLLRTPSIQRAARIGKIALTQFKNNEQLIAIRCDRGAKIVRKLGMGELAAQAVYALDEHWDGSGYPQRLRGNNIPILARICSIAQNIDIFATERSPKVAMDVLRERSGRWFDPELVRIACALDADRSLWTYCLRDADPDETRAVVMSLAPTESEWLAANQIDSICEAFADVVDAKSPFTYSHSVGVTEIAVCGALHMGFSTERVQLIRRASLMHDIGKLRVPNSILDKPGSLSDDEWHIVREHPGLTRQILERVGAFEEVAVLAGEHHERLDGSGYPNRRIASDLSIESRLLAVADVCSALSEDRPYHAPRNPAEIAAFLKNDLRSRLDVDCFEAVLFAVMESKRTRRDHSLPIICEAS